MNSVRGCETSMPSIVSRNGTRARRPAVDHFPRSPAPGNHGIVPITWSSQRFDRAANCCRLNGADSGSAAFGKIFVIARTRSTALEVEDLVHPQQLEDRQRLIARAGDLDRASRRA